MLLGGYLKLAIASIRSARWRSLLTMLGIIIGVVSVVTIVSLGEGVKQQVARQINQRGDDLITILPGQLVKRDKSGKIVSFNLRSARSTTSFSEADYNTVQKAQDVKLAVPFGKVIGVAQTKERDYQQAEVIATTEGVSEVLNQRLEYGAFYQDDEPAGNGAVIGRGVAEELFQENVPMGKSFTVRGREFFVRGIFEEFVATTTPTPGGDYNNAVFLPYKTGQELMGGNLLIYQILARPTDIAHIDSMADSINNTLKSQRGGQEDFTVLKQEENLALANNLLGILTNLIAGIAAISLLVGGIGIMNIMLVSVTERTREIGIRKAVGATNRQIMYQFLIEALVISFTGAVLGIMVSLLANFLLRIYTDLQPVITLPVVGVACALALAVGVFFGVAPALRAARKDPIAALRNE